MRHRLCVLVLGTAAAFACACDSPTAPVSPSGSSPSPSQTQLQLSGVVTDEGGAPIAGASIGLSTYLGSSYRYQTSTDGSGRYAFTFPKDLAVPSVISAHAADASNIQPLDWVGDTVVKDVRVKRPVNVVAGQTAVISFEPDSAMCIWEFSVSDRMACEYLAVATAAPGLLIVETRPLDGSSIVPLVGWENPGTGGSFSVRVEKSWRLWINLAIPRGFAARYEVRTSLAD